MTSNTQMWDIGRLRPYALNAKVHDDAQVGKIAASIKKFGWKGNPIVVDENEEILAGHGRRLAALKLGLQQVPVDQVFGMSADEKKAYRLADNRVAIGNLDTDLLAQDLATFDLNGLDGIFDAKELSFVVADLGTLNEEAFVANLDDEIEKQDLETTATLDAIADKQVALAKAFGFKTIKGKDERAVAIFMAQLEHDTGKTGADALIEFITTMNKAAA